MSRLRRLDRRFPAFSVAAEVLEVRSLLAGAAAAVHTAPHHAGVVPSSTPAPTFPANLKLVEDSTNLTLPGTLTMPPVQQAVGAHVQIHFTGSPGAGVIYAITFSAKVASIDTSHGPEIGVGLSKVKGQITVTSSL